MTRLEIALAVPAGSRRALGQKEFLLALGADIELSELRRDRQRNIAECARILARYASWADRTTRPTRARICALARVAVSTWKAARRWLEDHGYLGTVRQGTTPDFSPGVLSDPDAPNEAAIYVLCVPRKPVPIPVPAGQQKTRPLSRSRRGRVHPAPARERPRTPASDDGTPAWTVSYLQSQVAELRRGPGSGLSDRGVLAVARPFLAAGWSPADLAHAIRHHPQTGAHQVPVSWVREPVAWLAWRLCPWMTDPAGTWKAWRQLGRWDHDNWPVPGPSPSARRAAAAAADAARRSQVLAPRPQRAGPGAEARALLEQIRNRKRRP